MKKEDMDNILFCKEAFEDNLKKDIPDFDKLLYQSIIKSIDNLIAYIEFIEENNRRLLKEVRNLKYSGKGEIKNGSK